MRCSGNLVIKVDEEATARRVAQLQGYVAKQLLSGDDFICEHYDACKASRKSGHDFREGVMSHVGHRYDLRINGRPLRVVVVGQESGLPKGADAARFSRRVSLEERYVQVHDRSGLKRRYYAEGGHPPRSPHMRGTTSALRVVFGQGAGADYEGEWLHPANADPFHLFDGFALVNRLLCSAGPPGRSQGHSTGTMRANCLRHFAATLRILEPTVVILQGGGVARWAKPALLPTRTLTQYSWESTVGGNRVTVCAFSHPSARGTLRWGDRLTSPYFNEVVVPTLKHALRRRYSRFEP